MPRLRLAMTKGSFLTAYSCHCEAQSAKAISNATDDLEVIEFNIAAPGAKIKGDREPRGMF